MFKNSLEYPEFYTFTRHLGLKVYSINFNIEQLRENNEVYYRYRTVTLPPGEYSRDIVISSIIRQKYSDDKMQAIVNNYLLDPEDEENKQEFTEMQNYRKFAKNIADEFIKAIN